MHGPLTQNTTRPTIDHREGAKLPLQVLSIDKTEVFLVGVSTDRPSCQIVLCLTVQGLGVEYGEFHTLSEGVLTIHHHYQLCV